MATAEPYAIVVPFPKDCPPTDATTEALSLWATKAAEVGTPVSEPDTEILDAYDALKGSFPLDADMLRELGGVVRATGMVEGHAS